MVYNSCVKFGDNTICDDCVCKYMSMGNFLIQDWNWVFMVVIVDLVGFRFSMVCSDSFVHRSNFFFRGFL